MTRRYLRLCIFAACSFVWLWYLEPAAANPGANFRVGLILPLSGPLAEYGAAARNGIELAREEHPNLFTNLEFFYEDSQWDAKTAVAAFDKLRTVDKVSLVFNWGNPTTEAVAPIAERSRMPLLAMSSDPSATRGRKFVVRSLNAGKEFGRTLGQYLLRQGYKKVGVVIVANTYVQALYDGAEEVLGSAANIEIVERYNVGDQDFYSAVTKVRGKKYDALGVFLISGQVSNFYRQLSAQGVGVPTFGADFFESKAEIEAAKGGMNGAVFSNLDVERGFRQRYVSKFRGDSQIAFAGNGYDVAVVIGELFNGQSLSPDDILARLKGAGMREGAAGPFRVSDSETDPHFAYPIRMKRIEDDAVITLAAD